MDAPILKGTDELPSSGDKIIKQKGTVAAWFFNILVWLLVASWGIVAYLYINPSKQKELEAAKKDCEAEKLEIRGKDAEMISFWKDNYFEQRKRADSFDILKDNLKNENFKIQLGKMILQKDSYNTIRFTNKKK